MWQARLREAKSVEEVDKYEEMLQNLDKQAKSWSMRAVLLNLIVITCFFVLWSIYSAVFVFHAFIYSHIHTLHIYILWCQRPSSSTWFSVFNGVLLVCLQWCSIKMIFFLSSMVFYQNDILSVINGVLLYPKYTLICEALEEQPCFLLIKIVMKFFSVLFYSALTLMHKFRTTHKFGKELNTSLNTCLQLAAQATEWFLCKNRLTIIAQGAASTSFCGL